MSKEFLKINSNFETNTPNSNRGDTIRFNMLNSLSPKVNQSNIQNKDSKLNGNNGKFTSSILKEFAKEIKYSVKLSRKLSMQNIKKDYIENLIAPKKEKHKKSMLDLDFIKPNFHQSRKNLRKSNLNAKLHMEDNNRTLDLEDNSFACLKTNDFNDLFEEINKKEIKNKSNSSIYRRQFDEMQKQQQKRDLLIFKKKHEELLKLRDKPEIDENSKKLLEDKNIEPIYRRVNEIIENKSKKIDRLKNDIDLNKRKNNPEEYYSPISQKYDPEKFNNWLESNKRIKFFFENDLKKKREEKFNKQEEPTFIPVIDEKSKKIVSKKKNELNIHDKLYREYEIKKEKIESKIRDLTPKFTPFINKKYPHFLFSSNKNTNDQKQSKANTSELKNDKDNFKLSTINTTNMDNLNNNFNTDIPTKPQIKTLTDTEKITVDYEALKNEFKLFPMTQRSINENYSGKSSNLINGSLTDRGNQDSSYKININDNSAWDLNKENFVMYFPTVKFNNFIKGFINTRKSKFETIN